MTVFCFSTIAKGSASKQHSHFDDRFLLFVWLASSFVSWEWVLHGFEERKAIPPRATPLTEQGCNKIAPMKKQ
jgi:hypothetical protein